MIQSNNYDHSTDLRSRPITMSSIKWHNFCLIRSVMNIEEINRKHFVETDMYFKIGYGLSSKMINFQKGIFTLEVVISKKWDKGYNVTAQEIAKLWKNNYPELQYALGCKIFIVDTKKYPYKQYCIHRGIRPGYDAKKGIIFKEDHLN